MDEREFLEKIRRDLNEIPIPESLSPDQIEKRLDKSGTKKRKPPIFRIGMAAAACLVVVAAIWSFGVRIQSPEGTEKQMDTKSNAESPQEAAASVEKSAAETAFEEVSAIPTPRDYQELYERMGERAMGAMSDGAATEGIEDMGGMASGMESAMKQQSDSRKYTSEETTGYSKTNVQTERVDEGDIVKNDGHYFYIADVGSNKVRIVRVNNGQMQVEAEISVEAEGITQVRELYISGTSLIVLGEYVGSKLQDTGDSIFEKKQIQQTKAITYDVTNPSRPVKLGSLYQDGAYASSRMADGYLYVFSSYGVFLPERMTQYEEYIPSVGGVLLGTDCIYLPEEINNSNYLVISSVDIRKPDRAVDAKTVVTGAEHYYVSENNIYVAEQRWDTDMAEILKLSYENGKIHPKAIGNVKGRINDSFSMDEYKGFLRVVTTKWEEHTGESNNGLYVLDEEMNVVGSVEGLAPGENIYSSRFFGDTGYFVTFRETDPLFSVDLSDPTNPKVIGELKVTGFSEYLHFYDENLLLGLGEEVDPKTGDHKGLKLSMFDISDPSNVKEIHKDVLKNYYYSEALDDHRAMLIDPQKNLFGFSAEYNQTAKNGTDYLVFSYDPEKGFVSEYVSQRGYDAGSARMMRGGYVGSIFYLIRPLDGLSMESFDMEKGFEKISSLTE